MEETGFDSDSKRRARISIGGKERGSKFEWPGQQRRGRADSGWRAVWTGALTAPATAWAQG